MTESELEEPIITPPGARAHARTHAARRAIPVFHVQRCDNLMPVSDVA